MGMSKREKYILIMAVIAVSILFGDRYILSPMLNNRSELKSQLQEAQKKLDQANLLLRREDAINNQFEQLCNRGLTTNIEQLESDVLRYIRNCSQSCNLTLSSVQPDLMPLRAEFDGIGKMEFALSASGSMEAVSRFLWKLETSKLPLVIVNMQLGSSDESASKMNLQLRLSSVYLLAQKDKGNGKDG